MTITPFLILVVIALLLSILAMVKPNQYVLPVSVLLLAVALLVGASR